MLVRLQKGFLFVFVLLSLVLGLWLCAENTLPVPVILLGYPLDPQPLGLLIVATFAVGVGIGLLGNLLTTSWLFYKMKRLQKQLSLLENQASGRKS